MSMVIKTYNLISKFYFYKIFVVYGIYWTVIIILNINYLILSNLIKIKIQELNTGTIN